MEESKFYKNIWRANSLFIFIAGLAFVLVTLITLVVVAGFFISSLFELDARDLDVPANAPSQIEQFEIRNRGYDDNWGLPYTYFDVRSDRTKKTGGGSSYGYGPLRNIIIYNIENKETSTVFDGQNQSIDFFQPIHICVKTNSVDCVWVVSGFVLQVARRNPEKDVFRETWSMSPNGELIDQLSNQNSGAQVSIAKHDETNVVTLFDRASKTTTLFQINPLTLKFGEGTEITLK